MPFEFYPTPLTLPQSDERILVLDMISTCVCVCVFRWVLYFIGRIVNVCVCWWDWKPFKPSITPPSLHSSYTHTHTHTTSLSLIHAGIPQWHLIFHHSLPSIHLSFLDQVSVAQDCEYLSDFQGLVDLLCLHLQLKVVAFRKTLYIHTHIAYKTSHCTQENKPFKLLTLFCSLF